VDLTLNANGKAELYFHAYFWITYLDSLCQKSGRDLNDILVEVPELMRLSTLSSRPKMVVEKIKSLPFGEKEYERFINEFGGRHQVKKVPLL
jgi:hypothetical protein